MALKPQHYIAIEPDPMAFKALSSNTRGDLFQLALGDQPGSLPLFMKPDTADSSLVGNTSWPSVNVPIERLDSIVERLRLESIDVLKVEAEGFEPEVLAGAEHTLAMTRLVAVDVGPERGGSDTAAACVGLLHRHGFEIVDTRMFSGRMLFARASLNLRPAEAER